MKREHREKHTGEAGEEMFSIKEAAAYLNVSEPTLYRWMKEGRLSFFKIGSSTRFTREGLDALVEKTTGFKEAEAARGRCAVCGHSVLVDGVLRSTGQMYFKPDKTRFWSLKESLVPTRAKVCTACGYVQVFVEVEKLGGLLPQEAENMKGEGDEHSEQGVSVGEE
jgi:excisionase family DNA binding protein